MLGRRLATEIEAELGNFLHFDPFVESQPDHKYFVRSLYFDDPVHSAFYDKIDGLHTRSKFRIRTYTRDVNDATPQFLEEKGRYNNRVFKHRIPIDGVRFGASDTAASIDELLAQDASDNPTLNGFAYSYHRKQLGPVALVDYQRRPYISHYDPEFRVTFDSELEGTDTRVLFPAPSARSRRVLTGYTIMEVKFGHHLPSWFHRIIQSYELKRKSVSKICECMEALGMVIDLQ